MSPELLHRKDVIRKPFFIFGLNRKFLMFSSVCIVSLYLGVKSLIKPTLELSLCVI